MHGLLPFDTKGMDDPVPTIDFSPTGSLDSPYALERADVDGMSRFLILVLQSVFNLYMARPDNCPGGSGTIRSILR